jgi:SAM-dependent methyltransferase
VLSQFLPPGARTVLDVGCNVGDSLRWARDQGIERLRGVDINPAAVRAATKQLSGLGDVQVLHGSADELPFPDGSADVVLCLEVLEHIPEDLRGKSVSEMARVLAPGGRLILTVPHRGAFAFLDPENMRFRLPFLHRMLSRLVGGGGKERGYVGQKHGVVRHHHFTRAELEALLGSHFAIVGIRGRGLLLFPLCTWLQWPSYRRQRLRSRTFRFLDWLMRMDYGIRYPVALAYNVVVAADKR